MYKNIISLLFLITAVAIFIVWTKPLLNELDALEAQKKATEEVLVNSRGLQDLRDALLVKYNSVSGVELARFTIFFPVQSDTAGLMVELAQVTQANGAILKKVETREVNQESSQSLIKPRYGQVELSAVLSASYEGFRAVLSSLEKSLRLIDVENISFSSPGKANLYDFTIKARAYFQNQ